MSELRLTDSLATGETAVSGDSQTGSAAGGAGEAIAPGVMRAAWYALFVLSVVTLFAYLDRTILYLLAEPIKHRLGLSDLQLGLLQGTGVAVFAALASYPLGWLSDRFDRRLVMAGCIVFWSLAVVGCGFAQTFPQLLVSSALVGAGEAGLVPIVYSMIPDLFPASKRQLANSIFAVAASSVGGLAYFGGGQLIDAAERWHGSFPLGLQAFESWRLAFFVAAMPAPFMVLLVSTLKRSRRAADLPIAAVASEAESATHSLPLLPFVRDHAATIVPFLLGIGVAVLGFGASGAWLVVILTRIYGQTAAQVGAVVTPIVLLSTAAGFALSVWGVRWLGDRLGDRLPVRALWVSYIVTALGNISLLFTATATQFYIVSGVTATLTGAAGMLYPTAIQNMVPSHLRGRLVSIQAFIFLLCGAAAAPTVGFLSDHLTSQPKGLLLAVIAVSAPALLAGAALLWLSERTYLKTAVAARRVDAESS